jgi:hypothetical protein
MKKSKLERYIKNNQGEKVVMASTTVYLTKEQHEFILKMKINFSMLVRDHVDHIMSKYKNPLEDAS